MENLLMLISSITTVLIGLVFSKHINISKVFKYYISYTVR